MGLEGLKRESFVLHTEIRETLAELTDQQAGKLFKAIVEYAATGIEPELKGIVKVSFAPIRRLMDFNAERYERVKARRSEAGKKGAQARWNSKAMANDGKAMANDGLTEDCKLKTEDWRLKTESVSLTEIEEAHQRGGHESMTADEGFQRNLKAIRERAQKARGGMR